MNDTTTSYHTFVGVTLTAGNRPITYVALDTKRAIIARAEGDFGAVIDAIVEYNAALCAISAPQAPNAGLMADPAYRARLDPPPKRKSYSNHRVCEYALRRRGIALYSTPRAADRAPAWMQLGWRFYRALREAGTQHIEVQPHACFTVMLGHRPLKKQTLEGRLQRQLVLYRAGVRLPDPMTALEELTPHRLLMGDLRLGGLLYGHNALDAAAAAYTAWLSTHAPEQVTTVGDAAEGCITLPTDRLKDRYEKSSI